MAPASLAPSPQTAGWLRLTLRVGKGCAVITGITAGKLVDFGLKDSMNMGGCMAPAAADTIAQHLKDFGRKPSDYDVIFTGDLGTIGQHILLDLLSEQGIHMEKQHQDCGILIYDAETQDTHAGEAAAAALPRFSPPTFSPR